MRDPVYSRVVRQQVHLTVMPRMVLSPADVYMLPTTSVTFELYRVEQKQKDDWDETKTKVVLPDTVYEPKPRFSVALNAEGVATLSDDGKVVADTLGQTRIVVNDALIQFAEHERSKQPGRAITVVDPSAVRIVINGIRGLNVLEEGQSCAVLCCAVLYLASGNSLRTECSARGHWWVASSPIGRGGGEMQSISYLSVQWPAALAFC